MSEVFLQILPAVGAAVITFSLFLQVRDFLRLREAKRLTAAILSEKKEFTNLVRKSPETGRFEVANYREAEFWIRESSSRLHSNYAIPLARALDKPRKEILIDEISITSRVLREAPPKILEIAEIPGGVILQAKLPKSISRRISVAPTSSRADTR
ncbi:MAG: hypothetical protein KDN20_18930 [Verrucomicrobiae bacterium]|nr:hypothetical protein [Verrucomicrobiae bacterium]